MTDNALSRRAMLETTAAALAVPLLPAGSVSVPGAAAAAARPAAFLTAAELALLDELTELIIPADDHSPGARAAAVAAYIDARLAETLDAEWQASWRTGLAAVNTLSQELHGKRFMDSTAEQRVAVVTRMAAAEADPKAPAEQFFGQVKGATIQAYYTSKIGIQIDQEYKGNVYQQGDYAGFDAQ